MCLLGINLPNLCPNTNHFAAVDFSECHSEEVISFFWRSVYNWNELYDNNKELFTVKTYWFCIDYHKLNKITRPDSHPLSRIDDTLDALAGNIYFSTMDLSSGYWQVVIDPEDKAKTAFTTGTDLFQFTVIPMGLRNAPSTFQRLMQLVLRGLHWDSVLVYLDDIMIIVFGRTFDEKFSRLRTVFDRLMRSAGLKLRPDKRALFQREITFLGHVISSSGELPDPPTSTKSVHGPSPGMSQNCVHSLGFVPTIVGL